MNEPLPPTSRLPRPLVERLRFVQHQTMLLAVLVVITVAAFFLTRWLAGTARAMHQSDAEHWHDIGEQRLAAGDPVGAITALRRASAMHDGSRDVQLALAAAHNAAGETADARAVLLTARGRLPDDPEVNLRLARLEAATGQTAEAIRHYQAALLALWGQEQLPQRRQLRGEFIDFLLAQGSAARALSESLLLAGEIPNDLASHLDVGDRLLRSGDPARALQQFQAALALAPRDREALARAGEAAFEAGSFRLSHRYLSQSPASPGSQALLPVVELIVALDPLLPGLATRERHRRVAVAAGQLAAEIDRCRAGVCASADARCSEAEALADELTDARADLKREGRSGAPVDAGLSRIVAVSGRAASICKADDPVFRALALIAAHHGVGQ